MSAMSSEYSGLYTLECIQTLKGHEDRVWYCTFSPNGQFLASCSGDKTVCLWTIDNHSTNNQWKLLHRVEGRHSRTIRSVSFSPCSKYFVTGSFDGLTAVWKIESNDVECIASMEGHENEVKSVGWSPNGNLIASCSRDKSIWIWTADRENADFECLSVLTSHTQDVKMVRWCPTGDSNEFELVSASYDNSIKVWREDEDDWYNVETLNDHTSTVWAVDFNKDGTRMASCGDDLSIIIWDRPVSDSVSPGKWRSACTLTGYHKRCIFSCAFSPVTGALATGGGDDSIYIFQEDLEHKDPITKTPTYYNTAKQISSHESDVNCVAWHPSNGSLLASASDDGLIKIWKYSKI